MNITYTLKLPVSSSPYQNSCKHLEDGLNVELDELDELTHNSRSTRQINYNQELNAPLSVLASLALF